MQPTALVSTLLLLLPLASSHFTLQSPEVRGFDEDKLGNFPCGGQDFNGKRTPWPLTGGPIQLNMEHDRSAVQVLLGLGNDVGDNFNIILQPTLQEQGIGDFCLDNVNIPKSLNITSGQNATIQVVTNGDTNGGLYNCADITFLDSAPTPSECKNGKGVSTAKYTGKYTNANGTDAVSGSSATPSGTATTTATSTAASSRSGTAAPAATTSKPSGALRNLVAGKSWGVLMMVGLAVLL